MTKYTLHAHAARTPTPAPVPLDPAQLTRLSPGKRARYLRDLRRYWGQLLLPTPAAATITAILDALLEENDDAPPGAKTIAAFSGPNGAGKSTELWDWATRRHHAWTAGEPLGPNGLPTRALGPDRSCDHTPVLWISIPANAKIPDVNAQALAFLQTVTTGTIRDTTQRVLTLVRTMGVRVVVIDDVHLLVTHQRTGRTVLDHLKYLNTQLGEIGVTMVLVGANLINGALLSDPQIETRLIVEQIEPFEIRTARGRRAWQDLLREAERVYLPYLADTGPGAIAEQLPGPIYLRTQGYLRDTTKLLIHATLAAITDGTQALTLDHLDGARLSKRATREYADLTGTPAA